MPRPKPNLDALAEKTGFGRATVARALSPDNRYPMAEETRALIQKVARKMGYLGDWKGRILATGQSRQIGLVYAGDTPILTGVLGHVLEVLPQTLTRAGYQVLLIPVPHGPPVDLEARYRGQVDGFLVIPPSPPAMVRPESMPTVLVNVTLPHPLPAVLADDAGGMGLALAHLFERGHRRIAYLLPPESNTHYSVALRLEAYRRFLKSKKLTAQMIAPNELDGFLDLMKTNAKESATALVCYEHLAAMGVLSKAWRRQIQVPRDLSVVAFNSDRMLDLMQPPLTSVHVPITGMARRGAELLLRLLGGETADAPPPLPESLVIRESTAAIR